MNEADESSIATDGKSVIFTRLMSNARAVNGLFSIGELPRTTSIRKSPRNRDPRSSRHSRDFFPDIPMHSGVYVTSERFDAIFVITQAMRWSCGSKRIIRSSLAPLTRWITYIRLDESITAERKTKRERNESSVNCSRPSPEGRGKKKSRRATNDTTPLIEHFRSPTPAFCVRMLNVAGTFTGTEPRPLPKTTTRCVSMTLTPNGLPRRRRIECIVSRTGMVIGHVCIESIHHHRYRILYPTMNCTDNHRSFLC